MKYNYVLSLLAAAALAVSTPTHTADITPEATVKATSTVGQEITERLLALTGDDVKVGILTSLGVVAAYQGLCRLARENKTAYEKIMALIIGGGLTAGGLYAILYSGSILAGVQAPAGS